jgi:thiamine transport system ATP-binding protein
VVNDGRIEQVGTPERIYREPATRFVAGFVGENNLLDGDVERVDADGTVHVDVEDVTFAVAGGVATAGGASALAAGDRVTVSVRPAALDPDADTNRFDLTVDGTAFLGEYVRVDADWHSTRVVAHLADRPTSDRVTLGFAPAEARVFAVDD